MRKVTRHILSLLTGLLLASCSHPPETRLYTLAPIDAGAPATRGKVIPVTMGQVNLPHILDRGQLIMHPTPDRITVLQFDRWAAPLDDNIVRTLTVDLEHRLPAGTLIRSNGTPYDTSVGIVDLYIDKFDSDAAGHVTFDVAWTVTSGNPQKTLLRRTEHITADATDAGPAAMVDAMSRAVADLAGKIASALPAR